MAGNILDTNSLGSTDLNLFNYEYNKGYTLGGIDELIKSRGLYDRHKMDWYHKFNRFGTNGIMDPYSNLTNTKEYIFFTKPDLNILSASGALNPDLATKSDLFRDAYERYPNVLAQLCCSYKDAPQANNLSRLLSNSLINSIETPELESNSMETTANYYGTIISYRGSSTGSDKYIEFSLEFEDTKYLEMYMYFKLFDEYKRLTKAGSASNQERYIFSKVLNDQVSIYKFVVAEDGMTLLHWTRYTGCYPTSAPRSSFGDMREVRDKLTHSVSWRAQFVQDMNPSILAGFNRILELNSAVIPTLPLYNSKGNHTEGNWASFPFILKMNKERVRNKNKPSMLYYLMWAR